MVDGRSELSFDMMASSNCLQGFAQGGWSAGLLVCSLSMDSDSSLRFGWGLKSSQRGFISTVVVTVNLNLHFQRTYLEVRKFIRSTLS